MAGTIETAYSGTKEMLGIVAEKDALGVIIAVLDGKKPIDRVNAGEKQLALAAMAAKYPDEHDRGDYAKGLDANAVEFKSLYGLDGVSISSYGTFLSTENGRRINKEIFPPSLESVECTNATVTELSKNKLDAFMGTSAPIIVIVMKGTKPKVRLALEELKTDLPLIEPSAYGEIMYDLKSGHQ